MKKIDSLRNDQDREDTKTIVELMRDNMQIWEDDQLGNNKNTIDDTVSKAEGNSGTGTPAHND